MSDPPVEIFVERESLWFTVVEDSSYMAPALGISAAYCANDAGRDPRSDFKKGKNIY